ncbi:MAG: hypothetical protein LBT97_06295, partial [Planctomycetota bacterium]|nr:hypothetical protein [Planctomycetota bacterium]
GPDDAFPLAAPGRRLAGHGIQIHDFFHAAPFVDFWRKSNKPSFASLQSFPGLHFPPGIISWSALSPDLMKNQPAIN